MPTYFDPIMQEDTILDDSTCVYLVKLGDNSFSLKCVSSGLEKLPSDPTTQATEYWPIPTKTLSLEKVIAFFALDPRTEKPNQFNSSIKKELIDNWAQDMMRDLVGQAQPIPPTFFYRPIFIRLSHANHSHQEEQESNQLIPAIALFNMMPQEADNEGEAPQFLLQMFIMLMNPEMDQSEEQEEVNANQLH